jgi:hypothetical protein
MTQLEYQQLDLKLKEVKEKLDELLKDAKDSDVAGGLSDASNLVQQARRSVKWAYKDSL